MEITTLWFKLTNWHERNRGVVDWTSSTTRGTRTWARGAGATTYSVGSKGSKAEVCWLLRRQKRATWLYKCKECKLPDLGLALVPSAGPRCIYFPAIFYWRCPFSFPETYETPIYPVTIGNTAIRKRFPTRCPRTPMYIEACRDLFLVDGEVTCQYTISTLK